MSGPNETAIEALRAALERSGDAVALQLTVPRETAEKILELLEAEGAAGAVVVPVREQFTTTEAAKMLGISRTTLMKMIDAGEIDSVKVASHHRIPAPAIQEYERSRGIVRGRAAEAMEEFAADVKAGFQRNVSFGGHE